MLLCLTVTKWEVSVNERDMQVVTFNKAGEQEIMSLPVRTPLQKCPDKSNIRLTLPPNDNGNPFS